MRSNPLQAPPMDVGALVVERPPELPKPAPANPLVRLVPVVMIVATVGMVALYFTSGTGVTRNPMFALFPVMMVVSALGSLAYGARGTQRTADLEEGRRKYLRYLDELSDMTARTAEAQSRSTWWSHPEPAALWTLVGGARMWGRVPGDADFGHVRIGIGARPLSTPLVTPEVGAREDVDPVTSEALDRLLRDRSTVGGIPVTVDLSRHAMVIPEGDGDTVRGLVRAMICQLAVHHDPAEFAVAAVVDRVGAAAWDWLKWLPHHRRSASVDDAGSARRTHRELRDVDTAAARRTVVIVDGGVVAGASPAEEETVIAVGDVGDALATLPVDRIDASGGALPERPDTMTVSQALTCARRLARFTGVDQATDSRRSGAWAELAGIGEPGRIDAERLWRPRSDRGRLRVPIGLDEHGDLVELDLKEAADGGMGPHGLCVGATGSGKSEFLRTLTLGLVATHSPETLNLVLVDFKGGATFLGFERVNHVAAVITNLADEAHLVVRMRDALSGELTRRQELLRAAGNFANVAGYRAARARGAALAPLPTLFIVVDEFSELLSQHPDFADLFVAIGRVGRSLGVHLLLASQRLEEGRLRGLETHLSYRICLKTFSTSESRAVLGTAEAYDLPSEPGAAYLKTASGDMARFRAAFVSEPVANRAVNRARRPPLSPTVFTAVPVGRVRADTDTPRADHRSPTVLDAALDGLAGRGSPAHQVWLPPLQASPTVGFLLATTSAQTRLVVPIGFVDNPFQQRRDLLRADLRGAGGHVAVVGGPRSGKSTTLQTLVLALAATHDPAEVQIYGLDFGSGALFAVRELPHVGSVAGRFDRELVGRIIAHLQAVVRRRENAHRHAGPDGQRVDRHGEVFLVIDGWSVARQDIDGLEDAVTVLAAQGLSVGVHVVIATTRWAELRPALKDRLGTKIELRLGDPADSELDRKRAKLLVDRSAGHGITPAGLEMVVALPTLTDPAPSGGLDEALRSSVDTLRRRHPDVAAAPVALLPTLVGYDALLARSPAGAVLGLGGDELTPLPVDFIAHPHVLVIGETDCGKTNALRVLCRELVRVHAAGSAQLAIVDFRRTLLGVVEGDHLHGYAMSAPTAETQLAALAGQLRARLPDEAVTQRQLRERSWWSGPELYVVVDDYDLVAGGASNPLTPLVELLPQARDLGLHLIVARRSGGASRAMFDPLLSAMRDMGCLGLLMSASPDEGALLGAVRPSSLPPGRATLIRRGQPDQLVQIAWTDPP